MRIRDLLVKRKRRFESLDSMTLDGHLSSMYRALLPLLFAFGMVSCATRKEPVFHSADPPPGGTQKWNPVWWFGNADDPVPPEWYRPRQAGRGALWQLRNPLHNFTFYVIGVADKDFLRYGHEPEAVFSKDGGWNWTIIKQGWLRLPFVSYQGRRVQFYALWRERGNFGLKLNRRDTSSGTPVHPSGGKLPL